MGESRRRDRSGSPIRIRTDYSDAERIEIHRAWQERLAERPAKEHRLAMRFVGCFLLVLLGALVIAVDDALGWSANVGIPDWAVALLAMMPSFVLLYRLVWSDAHVLLRCPGCESEVSRIGYGRFCSHCGSDSGVQTWRRTQTCSRCVGVRKQPRETRYCAQCGIALVGEPVPADGGG